MDVATAVLTHSRGLKERQKVLHLAQMEPIADLNDSEDENRNQISHTFEMDVADSTDLEDGREILHTVEMEFADATESVDGKAVKEQLTILEMKTFKRNVCSLSQYDCLEETTEVDPLKIICVGGFTGGVRSKGVFIKDYLGIEPEFRIHPFSSIDFFLKRVDWRRRGNLKSHYSIVVELCEFSDMDRLSAMTRVFVQHSQGALVFWGPHNPSSLAEAVQWRQKINREVCSPIPCVLVAENVADSCVNPLQWIGPGKIFESELALDQFCKDHRFVDHFEIKSRDWESGEKSVFGQAVNCLLDEILENDKKEDKTWM